MKRRKWISLMVSLLALILCGCTAAQDKAPQTETSDAIVPTDYSDSAHWLNLPTALDKDVQERPFKVFSGYLYGRDICHVFAFLE